MVKSVDTRDLKSLALKSVPVRVRLPAPRRSKLCIACSDFFQKSERTHSDAPPFQPRPACAGLASDDGNGSDLNCLTAPKSTPNRGCFFDAGSRARTHSNADVRGTSACRRLDGGNSIHFRKVKMAIESGCRYKLPIMHSTSILSSPTRAQKCKKSTQSDALFCIYLSSRK